MDRLKAIAQHFLPRKMEVTQKSLSPPSLEELVAVLTPALKGNFERAEVSVVSCPDLRQTPFYLATEGISGDEKIADVGGESNLYPDPHFDRKYSMIEVAKHMSMSPERGHLLGAGAGPFHRLGTNSELSPNMSWEGSYDNVNNLTYYTKVEKVDGKDTIVCAKSPTTDFALMANLYGSSGLPGEVLKVTARARKGDQKAFHECIRDTLAENYGDTRQISMGGVFAIKRGKAYFHVMPEFPPSDELPFKDIKQLQNWLTWHDFEAPIVCLSVFHTADPHKLGLRKEHTHCFSLEGDRGGHYHNDYLADDANEAVEYEAYFNTAKTVYRIDQPQKKEKARNEFPQ